MLNLHRLRLFLSVVQHGSYTRAAQALHISQPAISAQIRRLEKDMGVRLLWQSGRQTRLTEEGEALWEYAQRIVGLCDEAIEVMNEYRSMKRGRLRIAATTTPGVYLLPPILGNLSEENPLLTIEFKIGNYSQVLTQLLNFEHDVAVVAGTKPDHPDLQVIHLTDDALIPVGSPRSLLAQLPLVPADEFARQRLLVREPGSGTREAVDRLFHDLAIEPVNIVELPNNEAIKQAVVANMGYAILPRSVVEEELNRGALRELEAPDLHCSRSVWLVYRKGKFVSPSVRRFFEALSAEGDIDKNVHKPAVGG